MGEFQVPADLGRIPGKIYSGEGFTNFTADQWKNFFLIYATVVLWDHLSSIDHKIHKSIYNSDKTNCGC